MVVVFGKKHLDFTNSEISYASFSAHKIGGPTGVELCWFAQAVGLPVLRWGQEQGRRPGTEKQ